MKKLEDIVNLFGDMDLKSIKSKNAKTGSTAFADRSSGDRTTLNGDPGFCPDKNFRQY